MHEWFAQPLATGRMDAMRQRSAAHRLRVAGGRDLTTRLSGPLLHAADRSADRLRQRRDTATAATAAACC